MRIPLWILIAATLCIVTSACQSNINKETSSKPTKPEVTVNPPRTESTSRVSPPANVPIHPNNKNLQATKFQATESEEITSTSYICSGKTREDLYTFYQQELSKQSWKPKNELSKSESTFSIQYEKEGQTLTLNLTKITDGVYVIANLITRK